VFQYCLRLLSGDTGKPLEELFQPRAGLEILEQRRDGHTRAAEYPGAAYPVREALDSGALRPVQHPFILAKSAQTR
jgi:hypothetical protein